MLCSYGGQSASTSAHSRSDTTLLNESAARENFDSPSSDMVAGSSPAVFSDIFKTLYPSPETGFGLSLAHDGRPRSNTTLLNNTTDFFLEENSRTATAGLTREQSPASFALSLTAVVDDTVTLRDHDEFLLPTDLRVQPIRPEQFSGWPISNGSRKLIISIFRTYPRLMAQPGRLPPFIHPFGCGLHNSYEKASRIDAHGFMSTSLLKPLAICVSISHIFNSKTVNSTEFLWQTIASEHRRIENEMQQFSPGELLAAVQSMVIYNTMRLIASDTDCSLDHEEMVRTMVKLGELYAQLHDGAFSPAVTRVLRPSWEEWIFEETRRRIAATCFLASLVTSAARSAILAPDLVYLPSSRALWEANDALTWEMEYNAFWTELKINSSRPRTVADLAAAQRSVGSGTAMRGNNRSVADMLDGWHADLDGLGMMLAAVCTDV